MKTPLFFRRLLLVALVLSGLAGMAFAGFDEDLEAARTEGPDAVKEVQARHAESEAGNPDYYIALANYWFNLSQEVSVTTHPAEPGGISVADPDTGAEVGSISRLGAANPELGRDAARLLREARERFPSRIDIALGLAYLLQQDGQHADAVEATLGILSQYTNDPESFTAKTGRPLSATEAGSTVRNACFDRSVDLYQEQTPETFALCADLASRAAQKFPSDARFLNLLGAVAITEGRNDEALQWLEKAHSTAPDDMLIRLNLAEQYADVGDRKKAATMAQSILDSKAASAAAYHEAARALLERTSAE